jgi:hypothetical protein
MQTKHTISKLPDPLRQAWDIDLDKKKIHNLGNKTKHNLTGQYQI